MTPRRPLSRCDHRLLLGTLLMLAATVAAGGTPARNSAAVVTPPEIVTHPVFAHPATPAEVLRLTARAAGPLRAAEVVRGKFVQRQQLTGLPKPLRSSGEFVFAKDAGVLWQTNEPFPSRVVLSRTGLVQQQGNDAVRLEAAREPGLRFVARVFFGLFALDVETLAEDFELHALAAADGWTVGLTPRAAALRGMFRHAILTGDRQLARIVLEQPRGDRTQIDLEDIRYDDPPLTAEERRQFP